MRELKASRTTQPATSTDHWRTVNCAKFSACGGRELVTSPPAPANACKPVEIASVRSELIWGPIRAIKVARTAARLSRAIRPDHYTLGYDCQPRLANREAARPIMLGIETNARALFDDYVLINTRAIDLGMSTDENVIHQNRS